MIIAISSSSPATPPVLSISAIRKEDKSRTLIKTGVTNRTAGHEGGRQRRAAASHQNPPRRQAQPRAAPQMTTSLPTALCNALEDLIRKFVDPADLRPFVDPRSVLVDNFAPVDELPPTPCPVVRGVIPRCLAGGAYIRNGPNPQHWPRGPYHLLDGDGMLHSLLLPKYDAGGGGTATLCSRYVRTYKYLLERQAGEPVVPNFIAFSGASGIARSVLNALRVLSGQMNPEDGFGVANTSLAFIGGRIYALHEMDLPYAVSISPENGEISTLGRCDFDGLLLRKMTAHPKKDPITGEVFAFRHDLFKPALTYFWFDSIGNKSASEVPIFSVRQMSCLHDFAITERYAVFPDIQIAIAPMDMMLRGGALIGSDGQKVPRIGVLPRYADSEAAMRWFELPGFNPIHLLNAWEEDGELVVVAPNLLSVEHALGQMELAEISMEMVRIGLRSGAVSRTPLSATNTDFGVINPAYTGRKSRYAYLGVGNPMPKISGVVKLDLSLAGKGDSVVARRDYGAGCLGGEPFFVAKGEREGEAEDEGYLVSYVHDEGRGESRFVVMDAQSPELDFVAEVLLPRRVPYGFHGLFVSKDELRSQRPH